MREEIRTAVEGVIAITNPAPTNETETCERIVYPLLRAAGYNPLEIRSQDRDSAKQKPDYTILPNAPDHTWFLEAKSWGVSLDDNHAQQAINYANTQGKRWVVLSNGREWRLYDNHIIGTADTKHACTVQLLDDSFPSFLEALSRHSIVQGKLEGYVSNERLYACLNEQLTRPDSDVVRAIGRAVQKLPGMGSVSLPDIAGYFRLNNSNSEPSASFSEPDLSATEQVEAPAEGEMVRTSSDAYQLATLSGNLITGKRPSAVILPNGQHVPIRTWKQLLVEVTMFALSEGRVPPLPLFMGPRAKSPLVIQGGAPEAGRLREAITLRHPHSNIVIESHFSASNICDACRRILATTGLSTADFCVKLDE